MPERDTSFNRNGHASAIQRGALNPVTPFKSIIWIWAGERPSTRFESPANLVKKKKKKNSSGWNEDCYWKRSLWLAFKWTFLILSCCWFKLVQVLGKYRVTRYTSVCTKRFVYLKLFQLLYRTCFKFLNLIICPLVIEFSTTNENESLTFSLKREREMEQFVRCSKHNLKVSRESF